MCPWRAATISCSQAACRLKQETRGGGRLSSWRRGFERHGQRRTSRFAKGKRVVQACAGCSRASSAAGCRRAGSNSGGIPDACLGQPWCSSLTRSHRRRAGAMAVAGRSTRRLSQRSERSGLVEQLLDQLTHDMSGRPDLSTSHL